MTMENDLVERLGVVGYRARCEPAGDYEFPWEFMPKDPTAYQIYDTVEPLVSLSEASGRIQALEAELARKTEALDKARDLVWQMELTDRVTATLAILDAARSALEEKTDV